jgi:hypothetical protein
MSDKNTARSSPAPDPPTGKTKLPTFHVHNCPQALIDRANAKAALKGKGVSEWVVQLLERETKKLKPLQDDYNEEDDE